jgi:CBS domain-containing protein
LGIELAGICFAPEASAVEVVGDELSKMKASEIMTLGVYTVRPEASLKEAASLMRERGSD